MAELKDRMTRDLELRNLAAPTKREYLRCCSNFVRYHMKPPQKLGEPAIKEYLHRLLKIGAGPETLKMNVAGLKFLYGVTLNRPKVVERIPWPKVPQTKPDILSGTEVLALLKAIDSVVPAMVLTTRTRQGCAFQRRADSKSKTSTASAASFTCVSARAAKTGTSCSARRC